MGGGESRREAAIFCLSNGLDQVSQGGGKAPCRRPLCFDTVRDFYCLVQIAARNAAPSRVGHPHSSPDPRVMARSPPLLVAPDDKALEVRAVALLADQSLQSGYDIGRLSRLAFFEQRVSA